MIFMLISIMRTIPKTLMITHNDRKLNASFSFVLVKPIPNKNNAPLSNTLGMLIIKPKNTATS